MLIQNILEITHEWKEFWKVFEEVTGLDASDEDWAPFSCSC